MAGKLVLVLIGLYFVHVSEAEQRCLRTQGRHKPSPSKEGLYDCHIYNENSCCTHETTRVLVNSSGNHIGNFIWTKCPPVSQECEDYIKNEMCFYYCSPNTYPWAERISSSSEIAPEDVGETYAGVPICSSYCDLFYTACRDQPICVTNWYTDWVVRYNPVSRRNESHCAASSNCSTFGDRFRDGRALCDGIFGNSYKYTTGSDCLVMSFTNFSDNPNDAVAARLARSTAPARTTSTCCSCAVLLSLATLVAMLWPRSLL